MKNKSHNHTQQHSPSSLREYAETAQMFIRELRDAGADPDDIISFLRDMFCAMPAVDADVFATEEEPTYTATQIARILGLYSMQGRPHAHAVSAILNHNINLDDSHKMDIVLFETRDFVVYYTRYDEYAIECALDWIDTHGLPPEVEGLCYTYHIYYKHSA